MFFTSSPSAKICTTAVFPACRLVNGNQYLWLVAKSTIPYVFGITWTVRCCCHNNIKKTCLAFRCIRPACIPWPHSPEKSSSSWYTPRAWKCGDSSLLPVVTWPNLACLVICSPWPTNSTWTFTVRWNLRNYSRTKAIQTGWVLYALSPRIVIYPRVDPGTSVGRGSDVKPSLSKRFCFFFI